jgi:hypothetical protein
VLESLFRDVLKQTQRRVRVAGGFLCGDCPREGEGGEGQPGGAQVAEDLDGGLGLGRVGGGRDGGRVGDGVRAEGGRRTVLGREG